MTDILKNYINGQWTSSNASQHLEVRNPATDEALALAPLSPPDEVDQAAQAAWMAFDAWRRTPATARIQHLFKLKELMEAHFEELARSVTLENGKVLEDARGEMRRAVENVEVA